MTKVVKAPDGRRLSAESLGDPEGKPVFLLHITPGGRNGPRPRGIVLYRLGIRLISYDRPGYPGSDRFPGRRIADAAVDVEAIADYFGIDRFSVVGMFGGAPHALACAALLRERVVCAAALGSLAPYDAEGLDWELGMADSNVRIYRDAETDLDALIATIKEQARQVKNGSEGMPELLWPSLASHDKEIIGDIALRRIIEKTRAAALRGTADGWIDDVIALSRPWGFELSEIRAPVKLWTGSDDVFSPVGHSYWLAARIKGTELEIEQGGAHFGAVEILPRILTWVAEKANLPTAEPLRSRRRRVSQAKRSSKASAVRAEEGQEVGAPTGDGRSKARLEQADQAESDAQAAFAQRAFDEAVGHLQKAIELDPGRAERLQPDLNCLSEHADDSPGRLAWRRGLWLALSSSSPLSGGDPISLTSAPTRSSGHRESGETVAPAAPVPEHLTVTAPRSEGKPRVPHKPQKAGDELEKAFIRLMERFFSFAKDDERAVIDKLRKQKAGLQYGHDVQFNCTPVGKSAVHCHVECKNYEHALKPEHIADKIWQTRSYWNAKKIDYFIIVTPRAGTNNELDYLIQAFNSDIGSPFRIEVWGPDQRIKEFFALEPLAYRAVYDAEPPPVPDIAAVVAHWSGRLTPVLRLPPAVKAYLTSRRMHALPGEDSAHFGALFDDSIEVDAVDSAGSPLGKLAHVLDSWIDDPARQRLLLLGEFGDGKSFASYRLTRLLASKYVENPTTTHFPIRLPLRDLISAGDPQELLSRRLQSLGADMRDWARLQDLGPTLVVLDGFDEMSPQLDPATVRKNLHLIAECVRYFGESKLIVTSRTHYFESTRMQARFLERLGQPVVARLAPLPRSERIKHLDAYARQLGLSEKFKQILSLYDPIGLAGKPLFLQMIKETLPELPDDHFDEIVLYDTSVRDSLKRKAEMLQEEDLETLQDEAIEGMIELLEALAVELLTKGGEPVDLLAFGQSNFEIARVLWRMSEEEPGAKQYEDARARLGMRSLLKPFPKQQENDAWHVTFCHRSMSEYFVAQALLRALRHDHPKASDLLSRVILRPEIINFAALGVNKDSSGPALAATLADLARSAGRDDMHGHVGANAITLAYRSRWRPPDSRWVRLDLSYADLSGADLTGADFTGSLLRYANLDNTDLSDVDLSNADLTGVRLEETAPVTYVAPGQADTSVVACYGDGTVREWLLDGARPVPRKLLDGLDGLRCAAYGPYGDLIVVDGPRLSLWTISGDRPTHNDAFAIRSGTEHLRFVGSTVSFARIDEDQPIAMLVDCQAATVVACVRLAHPGPVAFSSDTAALIDHEIGIALARLDRGNSVSIGHIGDVADIDVRQSEPGTAQVIIANGRGEAISETVTSHGDVLEPVNLRKQKLHEGPVLSVAFLSQDLVATGGTDRSLVISEWDDGRLRLLHRLKLTLRCAGLRTAGIQTDRERQLLEGLRDHAEQADGRR